MTEIEKLADMRDRYGTSSPIGRHCANLIKMLRNIPNYVRPTWATHESQTLQGKIRWQIAHIEAELAPRPVMGADPR
jgi:hypothetical protein